MERITQKTCIRKANHPETIYDELPEGVTREYYEEINEGYSGYVDMKDGKLWEQAIYKNINETDVLQRSINYNEVYPENEFSLLLMQQLTFNRNEIYRNKEGSIIRDIEMDENNREIHIRKYILAEETFYDPETGVIESYDCNGLLTGVTDVYNNQLDRDEYATKHILNANRVDTIKQQYTNKYTKNPKYDNRIIK